MPSCTKIQYFVGSVFPR